MAILDVSKAFDSVSHPAIFGTLEDYDVSGDFINYIKTFYNYSRTMITTDDYTSEAFQ